MITITLDDLQTAMQARAIMHEMERLAAEPPTQQRDEEMHALANICRQCLPLIKQEQAELRARQN